MYIHISLVQLQYVPWNDEDIVLLIRTYVRTGSAEAVCMSSFFPMHGTFFNQIPDIKINITPEMCMYSCCEVTCTCAYECPCMHVRYSMYRELLCQLCGVMPHIRMYMYSENYVCMCIT